MKVSVKIGYEDKTGEEVHLPLHQTFLDATTGAGKTLLMKSYAIRLVEQDSDYKVLFIDSKDRRDFTEFDGDIPLCFLQTTEPLVLRDLMESLLGAGMMYYFDKIIEEATFDTIGELFENLDRKIKDVAEGKIKIHGKELGKIRVIWYSLKKLRELLDRADISSSLSLREGINVMNVSLPGFKEVGLKRGFQQLIVRSTLLHQMSDYTKTVFMADEAHKWIPQRWSSIVKQPFSDYVAEGRSNENWMFIADQASSKVDKEPLKPCRNWIIGKQMQEHEVEDAMKMLEEVELEGQEILDLKPRDVKSLKTGFFWVVCDDFVKKVYAQPWWLPDEVARQVARGDLKPESSEVLKYERPFKVVLLRTGPRESWKEDWGDVIERIEKLEAIA